MDATGPSSEDAPQRETNGTSTDARAAAMRAAMLSVYHHSIGSRLQLRGAPAVLLPPQVEPVLLSDALETLAEDKLRLQTAIWTIARSVPPAPAGLQSEAERTLRHYPRELRDFLRQRRNAALLESMKLFDRRRVRYRREAHLYAAALIAYADSGLDEEMTVQGAPTAREAAQTDRSLDAFSSMLPQLPEGDAGSLNQAVNRVGLLGEHVAGDGARRPSTFTEFLHGDMPQVGADLVRARMQLRTLERDLGISLATYVAEFADAVAFAESFTERAGGEVSVFPVSSVTSQDAASLETQATVTALVSTTNFNCVRIGMDPQCWSECSDAFESTSYVTSGFDFAPIKNPPEVGSYGRDNQPDQPRALEERVTLTSAADGSELARFHNVLNIYIPQQPSDDRVNIRFDLSRSISSRVLWDERAGGILVNEGFLKARPVAEGVWRVTSRKTLRFSDRSPYSGAPGWSDYGQMLNYLAPSTLTWWIENEMYSATCPSILMKARAAQAAEGERSR